MCYSAQVWTEYRKYVRAFGADIDIKDYFQIYWRFREGMAKLPKGMERDFDEPATDDERRVKQVIEEYKAEEARCVEEDLFKQRKRLADAQRSLQTKTTKAATESARIAADKIEKCRLRLDDLRRTEPRDRDSRIFPAVYAPIMVWEGGRRVVKPMRYQCRPAGKPAFYDTKFPGTYNARRDNLEGFWKGQFGHTHCIMAVTAFYENVNQHKAEGRELRDGEKVQNLVLEFKPRPAHDMLVACLWSRWTGADEPDLLSFAAITDEPPAEVAAAGHDRCIIPIKPENIDTWLNPDPKNLAALYAILDDRDRPYYEHRLAA